MKAFKKIRKPLPSKPGRPQTTRKGKKGYNRKKEKKEEVQRGGENQNSGDTILNYKKSKGGF